MPQLLTADQKQICVIISKQYSDKFKHNLSEFLLHFVIILLIKHGYITSHQKWKKSKLWTFSNEHSLEKARTVLLDGKIMAKVLWDSKGIILISYLKNGTTITRQYYADLLDHFYAKLMKKEEEKRKKNPQHLSKKKVLFRQCTSTFTCNCSH